MVAPPARSEVNGKRMPGLVEAELATARQNQAGQPAPARLGDRRALDSLCRQLIHGGIQVVADQVQLMAGRTVDRMYRQFGGRQLEDEPASAGIDVWVAEHV